MKRSLHSFKYRRSIETDVRKTFARIRRAQRAARQRNEASVVSVAVVQTNLEPPPTLKE